MNQDSRAGSGWYESSCPYRTNYCIYVASYTIIFDPIMVVDSSRSSVHVRMG